MIRKTLEFDDLEISWPHHRVIGCPWDIHDQCHRPGTLAKDIKLIIYLVPGIRFLVGMFNLHVVEHGRGGALVTWQCVLVHYIL